jgi:hypothetical protein
MAGWSLTDALQAPVRQHASRAEHRPWPPPDSSCVDFVIWPLEDA